MKTATKNFVILLVFLLSLIFSKTNSQLYQGVCRRAYAAGFQKDAEVAHNLLGANTSNVDKSKIYITVKDGSIYAHSNYIVPGYDFEYSSKLATSQEIELEQLFTNLFYAEQPVDAESFYKSYNIFKNKVEIILDPIILESEKYSSIGFEEIKNLKFICPDEIIRDAAIIETKKGYKEYLIRYNQQILTRIKRQNLTYILSKLKNESFSSDNLKILSLIDNKATKLELEASFKAETIPFTEKNVENFINVLIQNKRNQVMILGHIEEGHFITLDNMGNEMFKISINDIEKIKKENNLNLIILGCNSAKNDAKSGALNSFNSIDFLKSLNKSKNAKTTEEFLNTIADGNFQFVVDDTYFNDASDIEKAIFTVYHEDKPNFNKFKFPPVGTVIFLPSSTSQESISEESNSQNDNSDTTSFASQNEGNNPIKKDDNTIAYVLIAGLAFLGIRFLYKKMVN